MTTIYKYRVFCIEEDTYVFTYSDIEPTLCPNNHSDRTINPAATSIIQTFSKQIVEVEEHTSGDFTFRGISNTVPSGTPGDVTIHDDAVWADLDIFLWKTVLYPRSDMIGDVINVRGIKGPGVDDNVVGVLAAPASASDTVLTVNSTVIDNVYKGMEVELDDTVTKENVGIITAIDSVNSTITVKTPLTNAFAAGTTKVRVEVVIIEDLFVHSSDYSIEIGAKGMKGKNVNAGDIMRIKYTNNDGLAKTVHWCVEYYNKASGA